MQVCSFLIQRLGGISLWKWKTEASFMLNFDKVQSRAKTYINTCSSSTPHSDLWNLECDKIFLALWVCLYLPKYFGNSRTRAPNKSSKVVDTRILHPHEKKEKWIRKDLLNSSSQKKEERRRGRVKELSHHHKKDIHHEHLQLTKVWRGYVFSKIGYLIIQNRSKRYTYLCPYLKRL